MSNIPGLEHLEKEGWEVVKFNYASQGEWFVDSEGRVISCGFPGGSDSKKIIVRKIEKPKQYRPFANAAEFKPHRDRWWMFGHDLRNHRRPPQDYDDSLYGSWEWQDIFESATFDDGSPFGVEVQS